MIIERPAPPSSPAAPSSFARDLEESRLSPAEVACLERFVNAAFPAKPGEAPLRIVTTSEIEDRAGVDYFAISPERHIPLQLKVRAQDCRKFGNNDIALETVCDTERNLPGWAVEQKASDAYLVSYWRDTRRFAGPWRMSRVVAATVTKRSEWESRYGIRSTFSNVGGLRTESRYFFVPMDEFERAVAWVSTTTSASVFSAPTSTAPISKESSNG